MTLDLEEAREHYFAAGGIESDLGPRNDPGWYWRRAAKLWRSRAERPVWGTSVVEAIEAARREGRNEEREACAKLAEAWIHDAGADIAETIRARGIVCAPVVS